MKYFLFLILTKFFIFQSTNNEWFAKSENRNYIVKINERKIYIQINDNLDEYKYEYEIFNKYKRIFKIAGVKYRYFIKDGNLYINYLERKKRIDVNEIVTLVFKPCSLKTPVEQRALIKN